MVDNDYAGNIFKSRSSISSHFSSLNSHFSNRACVVVDDRLYVIGGQEGDFMAKPGSPIFKCSRRHEVCDHASK